MTDQDTLTDRLAIEMLLHDLGHLQRGVRERAVQALAQMGEAAVEPLIAYLHDEYNRGRNLAARALGLIASPRAIPALSAALNDHDETVRSVAAWALGQIGDHSAIAALINATHDPKHCVRTRALASLQTLGHSIAPPTHFDEAIIHQHISGLRSRPIFVQQQAIQALAAIGSPAVPALLGALSLPEPWARKAAVVALGEIGDLSATAALEMLHHTDPDPLVRQAAALVLQKLAGHTAASDREV